MGAVGRVQRLAQHGMTYDQILAHYYRNTSLGHAEVARVRVQMASGASPR